MHPGIFLVIAAAAVAYFFVSRSATGADAPEPGQEVGGTLQYVDPPVNASPPGGGNPSDPQVQAFFALISSSEGTQGDYGVFYGGVSFSDFSTHPCELRADGTRLIAPVLLPDGKNFTTAAGKYQITLSTWNAYGGTAHYGSFDSSAQDACCADILANCGAMAQIDAGDVTGAQSTLSSQWASFGASTLEANNAAFVAAGGTMTS